MSGPLQSVTIPPDVAVRPKNLLLYNIDEPDRKEFQIIRTRKCHSSKGSKKKQSSLENEQKNPSGAGGPLSAEAMRIEGASNDLLYIIVGVLLSEEKVHEAESLAKNRASKLETVQQFKMAVHGSSIAPTSTTTIKVVLPIWPKGDNEDENSQKNSSSNYFVLCNMENGLCEALPMTGGVRNPNFFFYPEWTRSRTDLTQHRERSDEWTASVRKWSSEYRQGLKEDSQLPGSVKDELQHGPRARASPGLLSDQNEISGVPVSEEKATVKEICQAMGLTDAAPKDAVWVEQINDLLDLAAEHHALRMVMNGSEGVDLEIAKYAVNEFKVSPCSYKSLCHQ